MARQPCFPGEGAASRLLNRSRVLTPNAKRLWFEVYGFGGAGCWLNDEVLGRRLFVDASRLRGYRALLARAGFLRKTGRPAAAGRRVAGGDAWTATFPEQLVPTGRNPSETDLDELRPQFDRWIEQHRDAATAAPDRRPGLPETVRRIATTPVANGNRIGCESQQANEPLAGGASSRGEGVGGGGSTSAVGSTEPLPPSNQGLTGAREAAVTGRTEGGEEGDDRSIGRQGRNLHRDPIQNLCEIWGQRGTSSPGGGA